MPIELSHTLLEEASLSQTDINAGFEFRRYNDGKFEHTYITSDAVNRHLRVDAIAVEESEPYQIPEMYAEYSKIMLDYQLNREDKEDFENHRVCNLKSDLYDTTDVVKIARAEYFDMLATFYSFPYNYRNEETGAIEFRGSNYLYNDFGVIFPISSNYAVNPIGANTIAITKDGKIIITRQGKDAHTNSGKLMPSGSGVTSWHDYIDDQVNTLQGIVTHGAEYKLRIECDIPKRFGMKTTVLGMARVPLGMKPDFYCITEIDATVEELREAGAQGQGYDVLDAGESAARTLMAYIEDQNAKRPGAVSIQLYLEAQFLAETSR